MVQVPVASKVTVTPDTVHTPVVCELKLTARPEVAVAATVNCGVELSDWFDSVPKVIVWATLTAKLWLTAVAAV